MKKFIITILLLAAIGASIYYFKFYKDAEKARLISPSDIAEVTMGNIESVVTAQGTLEPKEYVDVGAQVSGVIKKIHFEIGDKINTGDLIAEIDPDIYEARVREDEAKLKSSYASKTEQEANLKLAQSKYERNKKLIKDKAISLEQYEDSENSYLVAKAKLESIDAQIEQQKSTIEANKTNLSYTKIYAPISGTIIKQAVNEGQTINANQTTPDVVTIANLDIMTVKADVAEADISKLKEAMDLYFTTLGSNSRKWFGKIGQILPNPKTENNVVLYNVLADIKNSDNHLMVGMTTQMFFILNQAQNVPIIPKNSLVRKIPTYDTEQGETYIVKVFHSQNNIEERRVVINMSDRINAAVAKGLEIGEKVLTGDAAKDNNPAQNRPAGMPRGMGRL